MGKQKDHLKQTYVPHVAMRCRGPRLIPCELNQHDVIHYPECSIKQLDIDLIEDKEPTWPFEWNRWLYK